MMTGIIIRLRLLEKGIICKALDEIVSCFLQGLGGLSGNGDFNETIQ